MKTNLFILIIILLSVGCSQTKEHQMKKDAEKVIEVSQKSNNWSSLMDLEVFLQSIQSKYQGEDVLKFMEILRKEVLSRKEKGEDCGLIELMYIWDKDFQKFESD